MDRYGMPPPPPPPPAASHTMDYGRSRYRSPSPARRYQSPPPPSSSYGSRYRSRSPAPRYRSRSPPRRFNDKKRAPAPVYRGTEEERARSTTLFVGNIPYGFEERDVMGLFERFGRLRLVYVPIDRFTRRNKGFAFVQFEQRLDAEDAFYKYNGYMIEGRKLRLDWDVGTERKDHLKVGPVDGGSGAPRDRPPYGSPQHRHRYESPPPPQRRDRSPMAPPRDAAW